MVSVYVRMTEIKQKGSEEARALLRQALLLRYPFLHIGEMLPVMETDVFGKPYFPDHPGIYFNISHTTGCVCCALGDRPVGVDAEALRTRKRLEYVVRCLAPEEQQYLEAGSEGEKETLFYRLWVQKESYLKADGRGLRIPLQSFSVLEGKIKTGEDEYHLHLYKEFEEMGICLAACSPEAEFAAPVLL